MPAALRRPLILAALVFAAPLASAGPDAARDPGRIAGKLTTHLGVDADTSEQIAAILAEGQEQGQRLREHARLQADALQAALQRADVAAMEAAMAELQQLQADARALHGATQADAMALMSPEQRATWTLHHLRRRHQQERVLQHLEATRRADPPLAVPFDGL